METTRRYIIEGAVVDIPLLYDEPSHKYLEIYMGLIEGHVYTPEGHPVLFTGEDACPWGQTADGGRCEDCGSCRHYRQARGTLMGVCGHEKKRRDPAAPAQDQ